MKIFLSLLLTFAFSTTFPQDNHRSEVPVPRGEFRAVWVTTVSNLDWPRPEHRGNVPAQKEYFIRYLDSLKSMNMNAVLLQVRSEGDAFYDSPYEPWSRYLGGSQGTDPGYDPIQFAIEEAHKRGIELHAWLNPYRLNASKSAGAGYFDSEHVYVEHPEWALEYNDGGKILNPGLPEVQQYLKMIIGDLINKYDLDGIHFDDYFYAYAGTPTSLDQETYDLYGAEYATIGDFRRGSINEMISEVWDTIQSVRPFIRFGVSPFGIYGNGMNPPGIAGLDAYNTIYCDPLAWLAEGTVDYITPQLYWPTGGAQDFATLLPWWAEKADLYNRHVYPGHGIYRLANDAPVARTDQEPSLHEMKEYFEMENSGSRLMADPWTLDQVATQVEIVRQNAELGALGSVYFRMFDFYRVDGLQEYLKEEVYFNKVLFPELTWKTSDTPQTPTNLRLEQAAGDSFFSLLWDHPKDSIRYVIYAFDPAEESANYISDENRLDLTYNKELNLTNANLPTGYLIVVTALNRYGVESVPSTVFEADKPDKVVLISPEHSAVNVTSDAKLMWNSARFASSYLMEIATDDQFTTGLRSFNLEDTTVFISELPLEGETTYFWRVAGENIGGTGEYSDPTSFSTGYPSNVTLVTPQNMAEKVALQPEILYEASAGSDFVQIQITEGGTSFNLSNTVLDVTLPRNEAGSYILQSPLRILYTHYIRIRGSNEFGESAWSPITQFRTLYPTAEPPSIVSPESHATEVEIPVTITWQASEGATSYVFQLSDDIDFNNLIVDQSVYGALSFTVNNLELGTPYYSRISARNAGGLGEWSEVLTFTTVSPITGLKDLDDIKILIYPNPGNGKFNLKGTTDAENDIISITDVLGKPVPFTVERGSNDILSVDLKDKVCHPCMVNIKTTEGLKVIKVFTK